MRSLGQEERLHVEMDEQKLEGRTRLLHFFNSSAHVKSTVNYSHDSSHLRLNEVPVSSHMLEWVVSFVGETS